MTAPSRIGRYEIVRRLGKSMTEVYLAIDTVENRRAALKLIQSGGDSVNQLMVEAERRGANIQREMHDLDPRVIEIYDIGDVDGYFYVAMQYVEGRNLAEVLKAESAVDPYRAATIALEICEQLAKFHSWQSTVVHGDIKPSNIHLGPHDTVRLLDFGIAKMLRAGRTATMHNFGSPGYCSPERLTRSEVDQQSDLWAVGATLYEMLAGEPPFQAESTRKLESLIRSGRPPRALPARCPRSLRAIATKALAPEPERRYNSAREFQADLQAFLEHKTTAAEMERRSAWSPNATIEAAREYIRKATRTLKRARIRLQVGGAVAWFALGMGLSIGGTFAWQAWQANRPAPQAAAPPDMALPRLYVATADRVLEAYRKSSDPSLHDFDWQKAEVCLARAVDMGGDDDRTLGKLALSRGYATLERLMGGQYSEASATQMRTNARDFFANAALEMPRDPAPHLALARLYVYSLPNVEQALSEFATAERLGAALGRREIEQQGDAWRLRALEQAEARQWEEAGKDAENARRQYQRIPGFDQVDAHLREVNGIHPPVVKKPGRRPRWR
jgi:eukaryotic-like serine/threonine-protein kinase